MAHSLLWRATMPKVGTAKLVSPARRVIGRLSAGRQKGASPEDKGRTGGRTVRLKSKIVIAAAQPLSGAGIRRPQPVETLFAVSRAVGSRRDITEVLRQATRELVRALAADFGSVWRVDPTDRALRPVAGYGVSPAARGASSAPAPPSRWLDEAATGEAIYSSNSRRDPRFNHPLLRLLPHQSVLIQPLRVSGELAGILAFVWTRCRHRFTDVELRLVAAVTEQAAIAIENAELLAEVRALNGDLGRRVADRTRALRRTSEELRASRGQLRALSTHLEQVREDERTRISREIHDELGQALTGLKMDLARVSAGDQGIDPSALPAAIDEMIGTVRRIASELRPQMLDDLGLVSALEWQGREFEERTGIKCRFHRRGVADEAGIDAERSTATYRIFQEILTNVARHSGASRVNASLEIVERSLRLTVRDNGTGVTEATSGRPCLGILGMKERAMAFGGKVTVTGAAGRGTVVRVRIPKHRPDTPDAREVRR